MKTNERITVHKDADALRRSLPPGPRHYLPTVDVIETDDEVILLANMPGVDAGKVEVSLEADKLRVAGSAELDSVTPEFKPLSLEFGPGRFARTFQVHEHVDMDAIHAEMKHGVLKITLPRCKERSGKQIEVNRE